MLCGGRFGNTEGDVAHFAFSRKNVKYIITIVNLVDTAICSAYCQMVKFYKIQDRILYIEVERALKERLKSLSKVEKAVLNLKTALSTVTSNTLSVM